MPVLTRARKRLNALPDSELTTYQRNLRNGNFPRTRKERGMVYMTVDTLATVPSIMLVDKFMSEEHGEEIYCERRGRNIRLGDSVNTIFCYGSQADPGGDLSSPGAKDFAEGFAESMFSILSFRSQEDKSPKFQTRDVIFRALAQREGPWPTGDEPYFSFSGMDLGASAALLAASHSPLKLRPRLLNLISYPLLLGNVRDARKDGERTQILRDLPSDSRVLFVTGSRDHMCPIDALNEVRNNMVADTYLVEVIGTDHDLNLLDSAGGAVGSQALRIWLGKWAATWTINAALGMDRSYTRLEWDSKSNKVVSSNWIQGPYNVTRLREEPDVEKPDERHADPDTEKPNKQRKSSKQYAVDKLVFNRGSREVYGQRRGRNIELDGKVSMIFCPGSVPDLSELRAKDFAEGFAQSEFTILSFQSLSRYRDNVGAFRALAEREGPSPTGDQPHFTFGGRGSGARAAVTAAIEIRDLKIRPRKLCLISFRLHHDRRRDGELHEVDTHCLQDNVREYCQVLFITGSRDQTCPINDLNKVRNQMVAETYLIEVVGADHNLVLLDSAGGRVGSRALRCWLGEFSATWTVNLVQGMKTSYIKLQWDKENRQVVSTGWIKGPYKVTRRPPSKQQLEIEKIQNSPPTMVPETITLPDGRKLYCEHGGKDIDPSHQLIGGATIYFTHGAGGDLSSPGVRDFSEAYSERRKILSFKGSSNFEIRVKDFHGLARLVYPDRPDRGSDSDPPLSMRFGGMSMGARAAVVAALESPPHRKPSGLVLVGYPLQPGAGDDDMRTQLLLDLPKGMRVLFVTGSRDHMCPIDVFEKVRSRMKAEGYLIEVIDADHGINLLPAAGGAAGSRALRNWIGRFSAYWFVGQIIISKPHLKIGWNQETQEVRRSWTWSSDINDRELFRSKGDSTRVAMS